jgi:hypothetical protein
MFFCLAMLFPFAGYASQSAVEERPETIVRKLYQEIIKLHPLGIPYGAEKETLRPFLSKRLVGKLDLGHACEADWDRQHKGDSGKPDIGWLEMGLFSGGNERALPSIASVEGTESRTDGSYFIHVKLTYKDSPNTYLDKHMDPKNTFSWSVAVKVISENGRFVVDDVLLFMKNSKELFTSDIFAQCSGPRWVGK